MEARSTQHLNQRQILTVKNWCGSKIAIYQLPWLRILEKIQRKLFKIDMIKYIYFSENFFFAHLTRFVPDKVYDWIIRNYFASNILVNSNYLIEPGAKKDHFEYMWFFYAHILILFGFYVSAHVTLVWMFLGEVPGRQGCRKLVSVVSRIQDNHGLVRQSGSQTTQLGQTMVI